MAPRGAYGALRWIGQRVAVTAMFSRAATAEVRRRTCGLQRQRKESSGKREQQQKSCYQSLHAFWSRAPNLK